MRKGTMAAASTLDLLLWIKLQNIGYQVRAGLASTYRMSDIEWYIGRYVHILKKTCLVFFHYSCSKHLFLVKQNVWCQCFNMTLLDSHFINFLIKKLLRKDSQNSYSMIKNNTICMHLYETLCMTLIIYNEVVNA